MTIPSQPLDEPTGGVTTLLRGWRPGRAHFLLAALIVVSVWLVVIFARSLGELDRATTRQQAIDAESRALALRLEADKRELQLVQTDGFQALQARAYGLGKPGEQVFSLVAGAPSPRPIVPLGQSSASATGPTKPLDAWLEILFGN